MSETKPQCRCFIRHAETKEARKAVGEALEYARKTGDLLGIKIAMVQLMPCHSAPSPTRKKI